MAELLTNGRGRIGNFLRSIIGEGFSYNNEYSFSFQKGQQPDNIVTYLNGKGFDSVISSSPAGIVGTNLKNISDKLVVLCEEISLPGVSSATGNARGISQGVDFKYAHSKIYNDLSISFMCTKKYEPMRFFQEWFHFVYEGGAGDRNSKTRSYTTRYYDDYCMNMKIFKDEDKSNKIEFSGDDPIQKKSLVYTLVNAFPTSISSVPLNTGASQVVRFTVNITYERWTFESYKSFTEFNDRSTPETFTP